MTTRVLLLFAALTAFVPTPDAHATTGQAWSVAVRGKTLTVTVYPAKPGVAAKGTVFMGSGDVGWVGLAVTLAEFLSDDGYVVAGINARQYLGTFTDGASHLLVTQVPDDFAVMAAALRARQMLPRPVVVGGVSEGAALAVAAAGNAGAHQWIDGVLTMGLPGTAELAFRWKDALTWLTKSDADEPSFNPHEVLPQIAPLPLAMLQSMHDEYVPEADYRRFERVAQEPKRFVLIDAANHRFTDKLPELRAQVQAALAWIAGFPRKAG